MTVLALTLVFLAAYAAGFVLIGVPLAMWSLRTWRNRNGKKNRALAFLFPMNCFTLGERALRQGIGTYECGEGLLHSMVTESELLNSAYDADARHACARYVFVSALLWPIRFSYLIVTGTLFFLVRAAEIFLTEWLPTSGGKLILSFKKDL